MLGMKTYQQSFIDACRAGIEADVRAYRKATGKGAPAGLAARACEAAYFNNLVIKLEYMFVHRITGIEGKDGNPLNEVRVLCNSLLFNQGKVQVDKLPGWPNSTVAKLTLPADQSVLKLEPGDEIALTEAEFGRLAAAFFAEIERRYT